jgi:hypothetical protein
MTNAENRTLVQLRALGNRDAFEQCLCDLDRHLSKANGQGRDALLALRDDVSRNYDRAVLECTRLGVR